MFKILLSLSLLLPAFSCQQDNFLRQRAQDQDFVFEANQGGTMTEVARIKSTGVLEMKNGKILSSTQDADVNICVDDGGVEKCMTLSGSTGDVTLPANLNVTGTFSGTLGNGTVSGGTGGVITDGSITTADLGTGAVMDSNVNSSAAISGTKINPNFGSQNIVTTGNATLGNIILGASRVDSGVLLPVLDDDTAVVEPTANIGAIFFYSAGSSGTSPVWGLASYRVTSVGNWIEPMFMSPNMEVALGQLNATSATDGKFMVSAASNGRIYFNNRRGSQHNLRYILF